MQTQTNTAKKQTSAAPKAAPKKGAASKKVDPKVTGQTTENGVTKTTLAPVPTKEERKAAAHARQLQKADEREQRAKQRLEQAEKRAADLVKKAQEREAKLTEDREKRAKDAETKKAQKAVEAEAKKLQKQADKAATKAKRAEARTAAKFEIVFTNGEGAKETVPFRKAVEARSYMAKLMKAGTVFSVNPLAGATEDDEDDNQSAAGASTEPQAQA